MIQSDALDFGSLNVSDGFISSLLLGFSIIAHFGANVSWGTSSVLIFVFSKTNQNRLYDLQFAKSYKIKYFAINYWLSVYH